MTPHGRPDPESDPHACSLCGQPLGETRRVEGRETCRSCGDSDEPATETPAEYRDPDVPDDLAGRYCTEAVESAVRDASGDLLGHAGLLDLDGVALPTAEDVARETPGPSVVLRTSFGSYHVWSLAVRPLDDWLTDVRDRWPVDLAHVELTERRDCWVVRIDEKVSVETGETVKPAPEPVGVERTPTDGPLSAPHARLLADSFDVDLSPASDRWVGSRADRRVYMADVGGRETGK